jgi:PTS system mannose-specific IIA component
MDRDGVEGHSKQFNSEINNQWAKLSDDEVQHRERFDAKVRERYGSAGAVPAVRSPNNRPRAPRWNGACARAPCHAGDGNSNTTIIGLVIVTHGGLARELRAALEYVVGPQGQLETISIATDEDVEARRQDILAAARGVDTGAGVVLLTDMFGGTPCNLAISLLDEAKVEVIAGVNLPMLVKLASVRGEVPLARAADLAKEAGRKYISVASQVLAGAP